MLLFDSLLCLVHNYFFSVSPERATAEEKRVKKENERQQRELVRLLEFLYHDLKIFQLLSAAVLGFDWCPRLVPLSLVPLSIYLSIIVFFLGKAATSRTTEGRERNESKIDPAG